MMKTTGLNGLLTAGFLLVGKLVLAQNAAADTNVNAVINDAWYSQGWFWIILVILVVILMGIFVRNRKNRWTENNRNRPLR